jgi:small subunit ribosomal protein S13
MPRIASVEIPDNKQIAIALTKIYGIGKTLAYEILKQAKVDPQKKTSELTDNQIILLRNIIQDKYKTGGVLKDEIRKNVKRLQMIHSYRGMRHQRSLPARGQNTQTNARTVRGNVKRTVATGRAKAPDKT